MHEKHLGLFLLVINFVFTFHYTLGAYINSSFLEHFVGVGSVGIAFTVSAIIALFFSSQIEKLLVRFGDIKIIITLLFFDILSLLALTFTSFSSHDALAPLTFISFVIHYVTAVFLLRLTLDIYFEDKMSESDTGIERGKLLTSSNFAWLLSPLVFGFLLSDGDFWKVYLIALILSILLFFAVLLKFPKRKEPKYKKIFFIKTMLTMWKDKNLFRIFLAAFLLQIFFSWMIIYLPIYLNQDIGMPWSTIGILFTIMLIPYVIVDIPLGYIADKYYGEKELLLFGFIISFMTILPIAFLSTSSFIVWAIILFFSRFGAAIIEIMADTYFFKKVGATDGNLISFYRSAQPWAYIVSPILASIVLFVFNAPLSILFVVLATIVLMGLFVILPIKDTK